MSNLETPKQHNTRRRTLMSLETPTYVSKSRRSAAVIKEVQLPKTPLVLSQQSDASLTPKDKKNGTTPKANVLDPVYERIKRDLNSPSAAARIRAQRALKSPGFCKANYQIFDVPHEEQDIITEEERQPYKPKTIREVFAKCRIYVEVRTGDDNRSAGIKSKLMSEGIKINEKLYKDTTHVIFKDGLLSTFKQAKKFGIPVTTILWIESCKAQRRLVDPSKFPISNLERYEHPEIYGRVRRQKSMQPEMSKLSSVPRNKVNELLDETDGDDLTTDEETLKDYAEMEMTVKEIDLTSNSSSINMVTQIDTMKTAEKAIAKRRITTFTPRPMEQTNCEPSQAWKSVDRRKTIISSQLSDELTPKNQTASGNRPLVFNSVNRIGSAARRSVLDISMNIFELNCRALSENKKKTEELNEENENPQDTSQNVTLSTTQIIQKPIVRKRKLFSTDNHDESIEFKENCLTPDSAIKKIKSDISASSKTAANDKPKTKVSDRRRTISFFKTRDKTENNSADVKVTPTKHATKYIVCTNMSQKDREMAHTAIKKLGGVIEKEVSEKTTHIITPNTERTMNLLRGIIRACYIIKSDWIIDSAKAGMFLDTMLYQHEICNNQKICERSILGKNFKNLIFSHFGPFYVNKDTIDNSKKFEYVKEIIELCNGAMTTDIRVARIIVSDRPISAPLAYRKPIVVISTYIFDSAMQGKMIPNAKYVPKAA